LPGRHDRGRYDDGVMAFVVGVVVGAAVVGLAVIVIAPSRRVRAEKALDPEDVTRVLLGQDPDERTGQQPVVEEHPRAYDASELAALRSIGQKPSTRRRKTS
jgi:hypothetical protein